MNDKRLDRPAGHNEACSEFFFASGNTGEPSLPAIDRGKERMREAALGDQGLQFG
jgi:hypothetical protein